jgi:hypothetical protein
MYLVKQKHPIAIRYDNTGVLEKHSWSMAFTLLDMEEYDPLLHLPKQRRDGAIQCTALSTLTGDLLIWSLEFNRSSEPDSRTSVANRHDSPLRND